MVDLQLIFLAAIATAMLAAFALIVTEGPTVLSTLTRLHQHMIERGRAHKARRAAIYGYADYVEQTAIPPVSQSPVSVSVPAIPAIDTSTLARTLTEAQRLEIMALAQTPKGKWAYSGKKLYALFGGNYNDHVATMRRLRGDSDLEPAEEPPILTPYAGRPTRASYYADEPELSYRPLD